MRTITFPDLSNRLTPRAMAYGGGVIALACVGALTFGLARPLATQAPTPEALAALQHAAFNQAETPLGLTRPQSVLVKVLYGETLESAIERAGARPEEARLAVASLGQAMDTVNIKAGMAIEAAIAAPRTRRGDTRLVSLSMRTGAASTITLSRTFDGALHLRPLVEKVIAETTVADGEITGSLYESALKLGASPTIISQTSNLFAHKLDFQRDIKPGDPFKLVFDRKVTESGRTIETGALEYAEVRGAKFYRFKRDQGPAEYFDETGKNIKGFLLRTPVDGARMTSSFGKRRHPILGYARAHKGVDFGAGTGTPVVSAGDGVVVEARRWSGYGNWLRIRHSGGWETGYAHLSRYAKGLRAGQRVRQGQVVAYVGSTGMSTGPHLHYEVWLKGQRVNPVGAKVPQGTVLAGVELARFKEAKARIDGMLANEAPTNLAAAETRAALQP
jgi:murein DD-endopeptidase MepM/ murein hydrolase activator NlpD